MRFHPVDAVETKAVASKIADSALTHNDSGQAILIYVQRLEDLKLVREGLAKNGCKDNVQQLTGTMRGYERDQLLQEDRIFRRFLKPDESHPEQTVYLVCTSAGEGGIDMTADHLVCEI